MKPVLVLQHVAHETIGTLANHFRAAGLAWQCIELYRHPVASLEELPLEEAAGLVVMGGPMNVNEVDRFPFLKREPRWIAQAREMELPLLGICLGAQLLARALGAEVYANPCKEIGWYDLEILPAASADPLLEGSGPLATVFQWHGDTFDLPHGAVHLAQSRLCRHQAFRHGPAAWGLQFHVEVTPEMVQSWLSQPDGKAEMAGIAYVDPAEISRRTPEAYPRMEAFGRHILPRFAALCRDRA